MTSVGDLTQNATTHSGLEYANQVGTVLTMPVNGWITSAHCYYGGYTTNPWSALAIWTAGGTLVWASVGFTPGVGLSEQTQSVPAVRASGGTGFILGFWRDPTADAIWGLDTTVATNWGAQTAPSGTGPQPFYENVPPFAAGGLSAAVDYVANATPNAGAWQSPTPSGAISDTNPTFSGTTPQNPSDSAYDICGQVTWQIYRTDTGAVVAQQTWSVNAGIASWTARPSDYGIVLQHGVPYSTKFQYSDSWGAWSPWSAANSFTINAGPNAPAVVSPTGLQNAVTGTNFTATYSHPTALAAQAVQVQVRDSTGASVLQDSGTVTKSVANNANYTVAQWFSTLSWGSQYTWWTRAQDTSSVWGPWSALGSFHTDTAPGAPILQAPANGAIVSTGSVVLQALLTDPNGSSLTSLEWDLWDTTANFEVTGYPVNVTGTFPSGTAQTRDVTASLILGHAYEWRAQCSDGTLNSPWSDWYTFTYTDIPSVSITAPTPSQVETASTATVSISYSGSAAKVTDETVIMDVTTGSELVYDSGPIISTRTTWSVPFSTLQNGHSYSITVTVTDTNGISATSAAVAFSASWSVTSGPRLQLLVGGVDLTANMDQDGWSTNQDWGRQGDTARITLTDEYVRGVPQVAVRGMATIELRDLNLGKQIFGGVCPKPRWQSLGPTMAQWVLQCQSPAVYLDSRIVSSDYTNETADYIARDILAQANCGITGNHIMPGPLIARFNGRNRTVTQALTRLCTYASTTDTYGWWVDGNSDLHFGAATQAQATPSGITLTDRVTGRSSATKGYYQTGTQSYYEWDATSLKTRILVQGGYLTRTYTEQFIGDGTTKAFRLSFPLETNPVYAALLINASPVAVSADSGATTAWVLVQGAPGVWSLSVQPGGQPPASGTTITLTYNYTAPVIAEVQSGAGIAAVPGPNQGIFDAIIEDASLTGLAPAQARALRELQEYALPQERVTIQTTEDWSGWLDVGQSFRFQNAFLPDSQNSMAAGIDANYLIIQLRSQGVAGGYRTQMITGVRI